MRWPQQVSTERMARDMAIRVLPPQLAAKIAAGEVVERPVSVAKELLENAIDAGATDIAVEIAQGGRQLIQVSDNGCGIAADEVEVAFARHATSKLASSDDLYQIRTLGFRGEALASIAAVSQVTLTTRTAGDAVGTEIRLEAGEVVHRGMQPRPPGTTVRVAHLFMNMPARLKFLRADRTEAGHIARLVSSYALAYPEVRLSLQSNGRLVLRTTGTGRLLDVLVAIYGLDVAEQMIQIPPEADAGKPVRVSGYVGSPALHRANRQDVIFFVNRRWVQDGSLSYAVSQAYHTLLPDRRHPLVVLDIRVPPEDVDVNIHPTKQEVRFRRGRELFSVVQRAVRTTLMAQHPIPQVSPYRGEGSPGGWQPTAVRGGEGQGAGGHTQHALDLHGVGSRADALAPAAWQTVDDDRADRLPMLRVVGQIAQTYIIAEGPGGMYLIDQHAAHERIRYEELAAQRERLNVPSQEMLEPVMLELSPQQAAMLAEHADDLAEWGFEITPFGGSTHLVKRIPASLVGGDVPAAVGEMLDAAQQGGAGFSWEDQALITLSCHTAVRAGQTLTPAEMRDLVRQLERSSLPHTCPHGRPTILRMTRAQLEREFARR